VIDETGKSVAAHGLYQFESGAIGIEQIDRFGFVTVKLEKLRSRVELDALGLKLRIHSFDISHPKSDLGDAKIVEPGVWVSSPRPGSMKFRSSSGGPFISFLRGR
jgi:hypothetical protein